MTDVCALMPDAGIFATRGDGFLVVLPGKSAIGLCVRSVRGNFRNVQEKWRYIPPEYRSTGAALQSAIRARTERSSPCPAIARLRTGRPLSQVPGAPSHRSGTGLSECHATPVREQVTGHVGSVEPMLSKLVYRSINNTPTLSFGECHGSPLVVGLQLVSGQEHVDTSVVDRTLVFYKIIARQEVGPIYECPGTAGQQL